MEHSFFITFEGGEGVGKTTQIKHLQKALSKKGHDIILSREPGGTPAAEEIRNLLSHPEYGGKWSPESEAMLLFAARSAHIKDVLAPALKAKKTILCDRYIDSTRAYQGYLQGMDMDFILTLEEKIVGKYMPNLTLILDLSAKEAMARVKARGGAQDHYDRGDIQLYETLRQAYLKIAQDNKNRCVIIDASQDEHTIAADILAAVEKRLN